MFEKNINATRIDQIINDSIKVEEIKLEMTL